MTTLGKPAVDAALSGWAVLLFSGMAMAQAALTSGTDFPPTEAEANASPLSLPDTLIQQNGVLVTTSGGLVTEYEWSPSCFTAPCPRSKPDWVAGLFRSGAAPWEGNFLLFAGVHGFRGPTDLGRSGNFGFHEGINWSAPIGDPWGFAYQVGFQAIHSNFAGSLLMPDAQASPLDSGARNQIFLTAALFRRAFGGGIQSGAAFDCFYDSYYDDTALLQIRSETALVLSDLREIGYWGAYGVSRDKITTIGEFDSLLDPTDLFAFFYRRHFTGGGQGRIWAGFSGNGDGVFGLEGTVPLGTSWALDNNFTYLIPKQGRGINGQREESWSVSIHLVWYPGRVSRDVFNDPHHPLFYVADNSWFLVDRRRCR